MYLLAEMVHIRRPLQIFVVLVVGQTKRGLGIERLRAEFLLQFAVLEQTGHLIIALNCQCHLFSFGNAVVECIKIAVAGKTQFAGARIGKVEHGVVGAEKFRTLGLGSSLYGKCHGIVVAHLRYRQFCIRLYFREVYRCFETPGLIHSRSLAELVALLVELLKRKFGIRASPALHGEGLQSREDAVVNIFCTDTIAYMVVPYGEHSSYHGRIAFLELHAADNGRCPIVVEIMAVEIIVIVAGSRHDVDQSVGDADKFIAQLLHIFRIGKTIVPATHENVVRLHGRFAGRMGERAPDHGLLAELLDILDIAVGKFAELLHHFLLAVGVFVRADMNARAAEYGILAADIFLEQAVQELIGFGLENIKMVHTVFL